MKRLAIITTHPIQYNAPLFQLLSQRKQIEIKVFYTWGISALKEKYDPGFGKVIDWDIPLLDGYDYEFVNNTATDKGSHHFKGIINPDIIPSLKKFEPDAILVYGWAFKSHLKVMRHFKKKIPVLFRGDSTLLNDDGVLHTLKRNVFLRWVYSFVDLAFYVGTNNYHYFMKAGLKEKQLVFAPHAIDNKRFECISDSCENEAKALRTKMNILSTALVFLFAGKLEAIKDVELLLLAFSQMKFDNTVHLIIVGNGPLEQELKSAYRSGNIHFMDFQNQKSMPSIYKFADVFVLPSKSETWGLSVNEAMANGKAIIVSNKCGCAIDLIEEGKNGFVFKSGDLEDLKNCLKKINSFNKNELLGFKERSRQIIGNFSLDRVATGIETTVNNGSLDLK